MFSRGDGEDVEAGLEESNWGEIIAIFGRVSKRFELIIEPRRLCLKRHLLAESIMVVVYTIHVSRKSCKQGSNRGYDTR